MPVTFTPSTNLRAALAAPLASAMAMLAGIALAVERQVHGADHAVRVEMRIHLLDLGRRNLAHIDVEGARHRCACAVDLVLALFGQRHA